MGYVESILQPQEQVLRVGKMHWITYVRGFILTAFGLFIMAAPVPANIELAFRIFAALVILSGLSSILQALITKYTTEIAVTNRRVIHKRGLIRRHTREMNMDKVESVLVDQSIVGRMLNYGTISVRGTGAGIEGLRHIADPLSVRSAIVVR
jgi:uncharacterized membrane protein YdbT with pleckstrin-like domain